MIRKYPQEIWPFPFWIAFFGGRWGREASFGTHLLVIQRSPGIGHSIYVMQKSTTGNECSPGLHILGKN